MIFFKNKNYPKKTGVYLIKNKQGQVIYIGKAKNLKNRISSYLTNAKGLKTQFLMGRAHSLDYILTSTEAEALLLEASLVKKHKPRYNIRLKDDKSYPYIRLSAKDPFPRFYLERKVKQDGSVYFGPYSGGGTARSIIRFLNENYQIRDCKDSFMKNRKTPCLTYQIGYCTAPCVKNVEYKKQVRSALNFLKGKDLDEIRKLKKQMKHMADQEKFEQALVIKNRISSIEEAWEKQLVVSAKDQTNVDVFSYCEDGLNVAFEILHIRKGRLIGHYSHFDRQWPIQDQEEAGLHFLIQYYMENLIPDKILLQNKLKPALLKKLKFALEQISGKNILIRQALRGNEKSWAQMAYENAKNKLKLSLQKYENLKEGLLEIQKLFQLKKFPHRIECYDISHFQSDFIYGSQVVFENGEKKPSDYRIYKLKSRNDDCASMRELLSRRFLHKEYEDPQLILVDGGKGQLQSAVQVLKKMNIEAFAVAVSKNRYFRNKKNQPAKARFKEKFYIDGRKNPIYIRENKKSFQIFIKLRDSAHRFALSQHRKQLRSHAFKSRLDSIKGIGEKRKENLMKEFKNLEGIKKAGQENIARILNGRKKLAQKIIQSLK